MRRFPIPSARYPNRASIVFMIAPTTKAVAVIRMTNAGAARTCSPQIRILMTLSRNPPPYAWQCTLVRGEFAQVEFPLDGRLQCVIRHGACGKNPINREPANGGLAISSNLAGMRL